jgi:ribosome-associated protein
MVHIMLPTVRAHYNLEELWQTVPKRAKKKVVEKDVEKDAEAE